MKQLTNNKSGFTYYIIFWLSQSVSQLGSAMTGFCPDNLGLQTDGFRNGGIPDDLLFLCALHSCQSFCRFIY